jgi:hypothetical protein
MVNKIVKKSSLNKLGAFSFLIGFVAAVTLGVFSAQITNPTQTIVLWALIILGIIIGLLNIKGKENHRFLMAGLTLVIVSYMGQGILAIVPQVGAILSALLVIFVPATVIVALRSVFEMAKD